MSDDVRAAEEAVKEAEKNLADAQAKAAFKEFPKWVEPDKSHIRTDAGGNISTPHFEWHIDRDGKVTVKVDDAEHEAAALAAAK